MKISFIIEFLLIQRSVGNRFPQFPNFQAGAASAQAQAFQNNGPLGGFGASAANAMAQNFNVGPGGINVSIISFS